MLTSLTKYLYGTRGERIAALTFLFLGFLALIFPSIYATFRAPKNIDFSCFLEDIHVANERGALTVAKTIENDKQVVLYHFNPNNISKEALIEFGVKEKTANTWINFLNKGGSFYKKEDVKKVYGLSEAAFAKLAPFMVFEKTITATANAIPKESPAKELFNFDPNTSSLEDFIKLGLSYKIAERIVKYRTKGGQFKTAQELLKIYGLSQVDYERLAPYIKIAPPITANANAKRDTVHAKKHPKKAISIRIDINKADAEKWQQLYGIGPSYSKRIINFREKLGGFVSINQVAETYGLPDSTFQHIRPYLDESPIFRALAVNTASLDELKSHPYIKWKQAERLFKYREQHGHFTSIQDLRKVLGAFDEGELERIAPYLMF